MVFCAAGLCRSAPGEVGIGGSSPVDESSPLRLRLGDDLLSSLLTAVIQNKTKSINAHAQSSRMFLSGLLIT